MDKILKEMLEQMDIVRRVRFVPHQFVYLFVILN